MSIISKTRRYVYKTIMNKVNPLKYAKKVGVNFIGDSFIYGSVHWGSEPWLITIGNGCHITNGVKFITHDGGTLLFRDIIPDLEITKPIVLGNKVYLGNNVMILPGVRIGDNVVVGAGSIVTKDVPSNTVVAGIPAKVIKTTEEYLKKIKKESLGLGHLKGQEKDLALKKYYGYKGKSKGIYY